MTLFQFPCVRLLAGRTLRRLGNRAATGDLYAALGARGFWRPLPQPVFVSGLVLAALAFASAGEASPQVVEQWMLRAYEAPGWAVEPLNVPRIGDVAIDGGAVWWDRGLAVCFLADEHHTVPEPSDLSAEVRLAWNDLGLLVAVRVRDDIAVEDDSMDRLWDGDSVEVFLSDGVGSTNRYQVAVAPGRDPKHDEPRHWFYPLGGEMTAEDMTLQKAARDTDDGYVIEVALPWSNIEGFEAGKGREFGLQIYVNDRDGPGGANWQWIGMHRLRNASTNPSAMAAMRLAQQPAQPVVARGEISMVAGELSVRMHGAAGLIGRTVSVDAGGQELASATFSARNGRAEAALILNDPSMQWPRLAASIDDEAAALLHIGDVGWIIDYEPPRSTSAELWAEYVDSSNSHPNIPNNSYAGYRYSEVELPEAKDIPVVADVTEHGAVGDGQSGHGNIEAFISAIEKAKEAGGGAILVPEGTYYMEYQIRLNASNLVLRGEGSDRTELYFPHSLSELHGRQRRYGHEGGLIRVHPEGGTRIISQTRVIESAERGDFTIRVEDSGGLDEGEMVHLVYQLAHAGDELFEAIAGHELMHQWDWGESSPPRSFVWPAEVVAADDGRITLNKPLRVRVEPEWNVWVETRGGYLRNMGVEGLTVRFPEYEIQRHGQYEGYNGVHFGRVLHGWLRDVHMENVDVGISVSHSSHLTLRDFVIRGGKNHHATTTRGNSHDNLFTDFRIESWPVHGLNVEQLSSGNVWRRGVMEHGTFDSHRGMPFDLIRTDITMTHDGVPGGGEGAGPFHGARVVHWNIRVTGEGPYRLEHPGFGRQQYQRNWWVYQPDVVSQGALVGIQGVVMSRRQARTPWGWSMVTGDKHCIVADHDQAPEPPDLFEAQLRLRIGR